MKTIVVSLIFLPIAAVVLALPMVRLLVPVWPEAVFERLDDEGRPKLALARPEAATVDVRSRPLSAAVLDRRDGERVLGYVVAIRDADGQTRTPPHDPLWWPRLEVPGCDLGVSVERVLDWRDCASFLRVHHPNRMTTVSRFRLALDRLIEPPRRHGSVIDDG